MVTYEDLGWVALVFTMGALFLGAPLLMKYYSRQAQNQPRPESVQPESVDDSTP